jgi:hypothetical protein
MAKPPQENHEPRGNMQIPSWLVPPDWQAKPNAARIYDYFLDGSHHFPVDRAAAEQFLKTDPDCFQRAQVNRRFLQRVVRFLCAQGVTQFLDLGSGLPTVGNVHEIALACTPHARILYVDHDPVVAMLTQHMLHEEQTDAAVLSLQADLRDPTTILSSKKVQDFLDFQQPIAVLCVAVLHFVTSDSLAAQAMRQFRDAVVPGSYLAISHASLDGAPPKLIEQYETLYAQSVTTFKGRSRREIAIFFGDFELVEPGIVWAPAWNPASTEALWVEQPARSLILAGLGQK